MYIEDVDAYIGANVPLTALIPASYLCPACGISIYDKTQHKEIGLPHFENQRFIGVDYFCKGHSMQTYYSTDKPRFQVVDGNILKLLYK